MTTSFLTAGRVDLPEIQRGDTVPFMLTFTSDSAPIPMAGKDVVFTLKFHESDPDADAVLTKTTTVPVGVDATAGIVRFQIEASESAELEYGMTYRYAVRIIEAAVPEPIERTYIKGAVKVRDA